MLSILPIQQLSGLLIPDENDHLDPRSLARDSSPREVEDQQLLVTSTSEIHDLARRSRSGLGSRDHGIRSILLQLEQLRAYTGIEEVWKRRL